MQEENINNPFKASINLWHVEFKTRYKNIQFLDLIFEEEALATSSYELSSESIDSEPDDVWMYICYFASEIDEDELRSIAGSYIEDIVNIYEEREEDWVSAVQRNAIPKYSGKFYVANQMQIYNCPPDLIPLEIDAGRAFGTGEHETTSLCLELLSLIDKNPQFVLDVGTGTGILAIAAKKLWPDSNVYGVDIDEIAIEVATKNTLINKSSVIYSTSYAQFLKEKKFDLIISNILANPLIAMSEDFSTLTKNNGIIILSGFIKNQFDDLLNVYKKLGFSVHRSLERNGWVAVMLEFKL